MRELRTGSGNGRRENPDALPGCAALIVKISRHDTDDMVCIVVEPQGSAEDMWVGAEDPLPKSVADDQFKVKAGCWVARIEHAA
jgi:hypothetical protein